MFNDRLPPATPEQLQQRLTRPNKPTNVANDELEGAMENPVVEISRDIFRLESDIRKLTIRVDKRLLTKNIQDSLGHFRKNFELYFESFKTPGNVDQIMTAGANVATYGESVGHILNRFSSLGFENRRLAQQIIQKSRSVNNALATKKEAFIVGLKNYKESDLPKLEKDMYTPEAAEPKSTVQSQGFGTTYRQTTRDTVKAKPATQQSASPAKPQPTPTAGSATKPQSGESTKAQTADAQVDHGIEELLDRNRRLIKHFMANAKKAEAAYSNKYKKIQQLHEEAIDEISSSKAEIEELKSRIANNTIARSFEQSAEEERNNADFYRYAAFGYMGVFFVLVGYLFFETSAVGFDWIKTAVRSLLSLTLLIPCGYVAKESSNHRRQQHSYMRTALELKVLTPHEGNLPETKLGSLREEVLDGNFSPKSVNKNYSDYYLKKNLDLLTELNGKLEIKNTSTEEKKAG